MNFVRLASRRTANARLAYAAPAAAVLSLAASFAQTVRADDTDQLQTVTVTGVGSSALGSAAFAWNVSEALAEPVAAIVPGYGLADLVPQALGGWFGFVLHDAVQSSTQRILAAFMPGLARVGRKLLASSPDCEKSPVTGAPVFRHGSAESDILHAILGHARGIRRVVLNKKYELLRHYVAMYAKLGATVVARSARAGRCDN